MLSQNFYIVTVLILTANPLFQVCECTFSGSLQQESDQFIIADRASIFAQNPDSTHHNYQQDFSQPHTSISEADQNDAGQHQSETEPNNHYNSLDSSLSNKDLTDRLAESVCRLDRGCQRRDGLNRTQLSNCARYKLENLLSSEILMSIMHDSSEECFKILKEFIELDKLINDFDVLFKNLLTRYNCHNGYSVKWSCGDCEIAYKDWLCATNLPYYMNGERVKPCISFCERVEQRCPYLHPITKEQYGGQPVFICRDPNIPFVPKITPDIPYSEPDKCYDLCHLSSNRTELIIDSLSKYNYDKCPDKGSIAEKVHNDPFYCSLDSHYQTPNRSNIQPYGQYDSSPMIEYPIEESILNATSSYKQLSHIRGETKVGMSLHMKKFNELKEISIMYKKQPKTHKFGHHSDHKSVGTKA